MVIFVDLVALSNGLHGSAKRIGWLCINVNLKMYSFDHLRMYNIDHINTCCSRR